MISNFLTSTPAGGSGLMSIILIVAMIVMFYFLVLRPQKKQEKEISKMLEELSVGDEITTIGGIIGEIVSIKDETVLIESSRDRTRIRILKGSIKCVDVKASEK